MSFEASFVYCGGGCGSRHPIVRDRASGDCLVCALFKHNAALVLGVQAAADLLQDGKAVQCHRALCALISSPPSSKGEP